MYRAAKETDIKTDFWTQWEKERVGWLERIALKHIDYHMQSWSPVGVWCMVQGTPSWCSVMTWRVGVAREVGGGSPGRGHMYAYGQFMLMYGKNYHNIEKQLSSSENKSIVFKKTHERTNPRWKHAKRRKECGPKTTFEKTMWKARAMKRNQPRPSIPPFSLDGHHPGSSLRVQCFYHFLSYRNPRGGQLLGIDGTLTVETNKTSYLRNHFATHATKIQNALLNNYQMLR